MNGEIVAALVPQLVAYLAASVSGGLVVGLAVSAVRIGLRPSIGMQRG